ncbi:MAG: ParB/RepB/Spo0J family partition protein [Planctomycetota bacterium]
MSNQRRLGRGLEALLGRSLDQTETIGEPAASAAGANPAQTPAADAAGSLRVSNPVVMSRDDAGQLWLDVGVVEPNPHQPRKHFDEGEIADLADSIREHGVLQPLVVREAPSENGGNRYELIAGERRLRAAQMAAWDRVPVQLKTVTDQQMAELAIVENVQRKDLNALEKAASFQRYLDQYGCTQEDLAKRIHIDRSTIANLIRLLELPEPVKAMLSAGDLSQGHARALLPLGDEAEQVEFAERVKKESLSVRATEQAVQNHVHAIDDDLLRIVGEDGISRKPSSAAARSEQLAHLEQQLQTAIGVKVGVSQNAKGKGKITLHFKDADEFERLRTLLTSPAGAAKEMA